MKIVINLKGKKEVEFEAIYDQMAKDSKITEADLAKMCFDQGLEKVGKAVGLVEKCPRCSKPVCHCGDPNVAHCSDSRCGWTYGVSK